ncbi:helix-turn-helix domain-containing protein [Longispora albida]|uniref:helix-turn-helix domain-containing protein n=1 Tax=Longispora albida TaxID=203523 RepID=UPI0003787A8B|nr:helix-turn-helix transcriptional regulator [Longispora albida]
MNLSDMIPLGQEIENARRTNPDFRKLWEVSTLARDVAVQIVRYRAEHNLTQAELGRLTGMTQPAVARLESGDEPPTLKTLARVTAATGLTFHLAVAHGVVHLEDAVA